MKPAENFPGIISCTICPYYVDYLPKKEAKKLLRKWVKSGKELK